MVGKLFKFTHTSTQTRCTGQMQFTLILPCCWFFFCFSFFSQCWDKLQNIPTSNEANMCPLILCIVYMVDMHTKMRMNLLLHGIVFTCGRALRYSLTWFGFWLFGLDFTLIFTTAASASRLYISMRIRLLYSLMSLSCTHIIFNATDRIS